MEEKNLFETVDYSENVYQECDVDTYDYCRTNKRGIYVDSDENDDYNEEFVEFEEEEQSSFEEFNERKLNESRYMNESTKYHFFKQEEDFLEPFRTKLNLMYKKDGKNYNAIVMKELDKTHFVFLISEQSADGKTTTRLKKFDISDVSVYI